MAPNKLEQYPTQLEIPFQKNKDATPEEVDEWMSTDYLYGQASLTQCRCL